MDNLITPGKKKTVLPRSLFVLCPLGLCQNHGAIYLLKAEETLRFCQKPLFFNGFSLIVVQAYHLKTNAKEHFAKHIQQTYKHTNSHGNLIV